ncbi:hypothetical protein [Holdemanella porci]|uniref:Uncharacterized protein n=1 Tax=Holdemanella porci TaxID=2652276 RepID=A0A6N7VH37_9FIRM|nr:hypothetical protein [Holdemanella porci]MDY5474176.1 hypothetical protein [Holdemanella porci]MSS56222.1 hypothetical protein [Holdemanella porci]
MKQKRLSRKIRKSYTIQTNIDELAEVLAKLLYELKIDQIHIMTYKDRIDIFATKKMKLLYVELYEKIFSLTDDDIDRIDEYEKRIQKLKESK